MSRALRWLRASAIGPGLVGWDARGHDTLGPSSSHASAAQ